MKQKNKSIFLIFLILAVAIFFSLLLKNCTKNVESHFETNFSSGKITKKFGYSSGKNRFSLASDYIALLYIQGVIQKANRDYNQKWLLETIETLSEDKKNRGILLFVDSPGGTVYESDEAYLALLDYKKQTGRPIYAYFASLAASGGYYIASAADYIFANRNTLTGSIGVIAGQSVDATELMEKIGIKMRTFTAGRNKNMGGLDQPLTAEQADIMQSIADDAYEQFTQIVSDSRNLPIERVREIADGRIYTARQAKENQLIDEIASFEEAKNAIEDDLEETLDFIDYKYEYKETLADIFGFVRSFSEPPRAEIRLEYLAQ